MLNKLNKRGAGFTIIEVLIVLTIAGLILLIVFLAVPALERNAHNTSAKNDVAGLLAAMNEYVNNNNGMMPQVEAAGSSPAVGGTYYVGDTSANCLSTPSENCAVAKLGYFSAANVSIVSGATTIPTAPGLGNVIIVLNAICSGNAATNSGASARNFVALYTLEGGAQECQQGS